MIADLLEYGILNCYQLTNPKSNFTTDYTTVGVGTVVTYNSAVTQATRKCNIQLDGRWK